MAIGHEDGRRRTCHDLVRAGSVRSRWPVASDHNVQPQPQFSDPCLGRGNQTIRSVQRRQAHVGRLRQTSRIGGARHVTFLNTTTAPSITEAVDVQNYTADHYGVTNYKRVSGGPRTSLRTDPLGNDLHWTSLRRVQTLTEQKRLRHPASVSAGTRPATRARERRLRMYYTHIQSNLAAIS